MELVKAKYDYEAKKMLANIEPDLLDALFDARVIVAGGIISRLFSSRETKDADIDVYFRDRESLARVLRSIRGTGNIVFDYTDKSIMIKSGEALVQLIIIDYFEKIEDLFDKFDFTVVMGAFDMDREEFYFHPSFFHDNSQRRLVYNPGTMFPIISSLRVQKYTNEGYSISRNEFLKIMISIMDLNIQSWDEIESQFGRFYGTNVADIITDEVKSSPYSSEKLISVIDALSSEYYSYKKNEAGKNIVNFDKFISRITGIKEKAYKWGSKLLVYDDAWTSIGRWDDDIYIDSGEDVPVDRNRIYKYVIQKDDGTLVAPFHATFVYTVGEIAKDYGNGLWFFYLPGVHRSKMSYGGGGNRVLIECEPVRIKQESSMPDTDAIFYEVKVLRIVPKSEEESIIGKDKNNQAPF